MAEQFGGRVGLHDLYRELRSELRWHWVLGQGEERFLEGDPWGEGGGTTLVGFLNFIRPHAIQVLGSTEMAFLTEEGRHDLDRFFAARPIAFVIGERQPLPDFLRAAAERYGVAVFLSHAPAAHILSRVHHFLTRTLSARRILHGVFLDVLGMGVLLQGEPGIGKSELALELLSRGHRLIADDSVICVRMAPDVIVGTCPPPLLNYLEVRGLGIVNIRDMFGAAAIARSKRLRLAVEIKRMTDQELADIDRLQGSISSEDILDVSIPRLTLPVSPVRNLAVLVEAAARSQYLKESGVDTLADFDAQVRRVAERGG